MLPEFENFVSKNKLFSKKDKLLLAISGGPDSICLFNLLLAGGYTFELAHCNFLLRGKDSDNDEKFVKKLADKNGIRCHIRHFDTKAESKKSGCGTQETARNLRYEWFDTLKKRFKFNKILTAHHMSDNTETMLINIMRSTGISGLHGISVLNADIARPLLFTDRSGIESYLKKHKLKFRIDKSNDGDDYLRNRIRHHLIPEFKKIDPAFDRIIYKVAGNIREFEQMSADMLSAFRHQSLKSNGDRFSISDKSLENFTEPAVFLYFMLREYGFSRESCQTFSHYQNSRVGTYIESELWRLIRERGGFTLEKKLPFSPVSFTLKEPGFVEFGNGIELSIKKIKPIDVNYKKKNTLFFDASKCSFPLEIRTWKAADKMQPLGMNGRKKLSDIFTDKKISNALRSSQLVLCNKDGNIMAWLPEMCSELYRVDTYSRSVLAVSIKIL